MVAALCSDPEIVCFATISHMLKIVHMLIGGIAGQSAAKSFQMEGAPSLRSILIGLWGESESFLSFQRSVWTAAGMP